MKKILLASFCVWIISLCAVFILSAHGGKMHFGSPHVQLVSYICIAASAIMALSAICVAIRYLYSDATTTFSKVFWTLWLASFTIGSILQQFQYTRGTELTSMIFLASSSFMMIIVLRTILRYFSFGYYDD